jgi:K+-sensing histidine kinase KdpD
MRMDSLVQEQGPPAGRATRGAVLAIVDPAVDWRPVAEAAAELSAALKTSWTALHVETPAKDSVSAAQAFGIAAELGGAAVSVPAASQSDGVAAFTGHIAVSHIVLADSGGRRWLGRRTTLLRELLEQNPVARLVVVPVETPMRARVWERSARTTPAGPWPYLLAVLAVAATIPALILLKTLMGSQALALLFLLPVIGIAARFGFLPSLVATVLSAVSYDFFILGPVNSLSLGAPQNLLMLAVLTALAGYTSVLTSRLRARLQLSDRSAQENAALAAFGSGLAKAADWESTARVVCEEISGMLNVRAAVFREVDGSLVLVAAHPASPAFSPVDHAALDLAWRDGDETGSGTARVGAADWQFLPLKTSLGRLAILGIASDDGRDPVRADKKVLLSTMITQAALAHERLRLEDLHALRPRPLRGT